jgi:hypothetical protein
MGVTLGDDRINIACRQPLNLLTLGANLDGIGIDVIAVKLVFLARVVRSKAASFV